MKIAAVGSTGALGRALIPLLVAEGYEVRAVARSAEKAKKLFPRDVEIAACDLLAPDAHETIAAALQGCEAVLHIATAIPADASAPNAWEANTRLRTEVVRLLLDASINAGANWYLQQGITMSYPDCGDAWITEDTPLDTSPARALITAPVVQMETMIRETPLSSLHWCILRGGSFVGPGTFQDQLIEELRAGQATVPGDGHNYVSFIHVADIASAFFHALKHATPGSIYNIVAEPMRQADYLDQLAAAIGADKPRRDESLSLPPSWRCDNGRAKSVLGWQPVHPIIPA